MLLRDKDFYKKIAKMKANTFNKNIKSDHELTSQQQKTWQSKQLNSMESLDSGRSNLFKTKKLTEVDFYNYDPFVMTP